MRLFINKLCFILFLYSISSLGNATDNPYFSITVTCHGNPACIYSGQEIAVDIVITNISGENIGYPLKYLNRRGPAVTLVDRATGDETNLRVNLAPYNLLKDFTMVKPGGSLKMDTIIHKSELIRFRQNFVDLVALISPAANIQVEGIDELVLFRDVGTLEIKGNDTIDRM
jgi:hypothetical protein